MEKKSRGAFEVVHCSLDKAEICVVSWKDNGVVIMGIELLWSESYCPG